MEKYSFGMCYKIRENNFYDFKKVHRSDRMLKTPKKPTKPQKTWKFKMFNICRVGYR